VQYNRTSCETADFFPGKGLQKDPICLKTTKHILYPPPKKFKSKIPDNLWQAEAEQGARAPLPPPLRTLCWIWIGSYNFDVKLISFLKYFFGVTCPFWLSLLLWLFFCHQVVLLIHLVIRWALESNSCPRTMAQTVSPRHSPLDQGASDVKLILLIYTLPKFCLKIQFNIFSNKFKRICTNPN
jgi:hypothetical protein